MAHYDAKFISLCLHFPDLWPSQLCHAWEICTYQLTASHRAVAMQCQTGLGDSGNQPVWVHQLTSFVGNRHGPSKPSCSIILHKFEWHKHNSKIISYNCEVVSCRRFIMFANSLRKYWTILIDHCDVDNRSINAWMTVLTNILNT